MQRNTAANHIVFKTVHALTTGWFGMFFRRKIRSTVTSKALHKKLNWCVEKKLIKSAWCNNKRVKLWVLLLPWRLSAKRQKWGCVVHYNSWLTTSSQTPTWSWSFMSERWKEPRVRKSLWPLRLSTFSESCSVQRLLSTWPFLSRYYLLRLTSGTRSRQTLCQLELECEAIPTPKFRNPRYTPSHTFKQLGGSWLNVLSHIWLQQPPDAVKSRRGS